MSNQQLKKCVCSADFRDAARNKMPLAAFQYIDSGSQDQKTLRQNQSSFHKLMIIPRILMSSSKTDLKTTIFNWNLSLPFGISPWAMNVISHPDGQLIPARVASQSNIIFTLSTLSTKSFKDITAYNINGIRLMQMYISNDWALTQGQIKLAEIYGFAGIVITVDAQVLGIRKRQAKNIFDSSKLQFPVLEEIKAYSNSKNEYKQRKSLLANRDLSMNWQTITKIRKLTKLKIILKGIMHPKDAQISLNYCDAIWISNHGGRQLDGISSTINILPLIKSVVGNKLPIFIDGGIRTGNDIYKCLALGANYVFIGRPVAYSMGFGLQGLIKLIKILEQQLNRVLILVGCQSLKQIKASSIVPEPTL